MQPVRVSLFIFVAALCAVLMPWRTAWAQTPDPQTPPPRFEDQIVVTPNRSESTVDSTPAFITLLDRGDIDASSAQDIPDLLRQAGVSVTDLTGNGRSYRVDLRGFGATASLNTLVLVDGRPVNQPDLSGTDWFQIPLSRVERIEVIRGSAGAVAFGDNATGGVVNIITVDRGQQAQQGSVDVRGGSYGSFSTDAGIGGSRGAVSYSASGRYNRSDGYRKNAQTDGGDLGGQVTFRKTDFEVGVSGAYHGDTTGLPGALTEAELASGIARNDTVHPDDFAEVDDGYVMVTPKYSIGPESYFALDFSVRQRNSSFFSTFIGGEFTGETGLDTVSASPKAVLKVASGSVVHRIVGGFDVSSATEDISNTSVFDGFEDIGLFKLEKDDRGLYIQDQMQVGAANLTAGYRYDWADYHFSPSEPSSIDYDAWAGNVGATVDLQKRATLFGRLSRSFRYPVLDEMFDFFGNTIQTGLMPQRSVDLEGGVRFGSDAVNGSVSVFTLKTDDEIFFNPVGGSFGFGANENLDGTSRRTGVEASLSTQAGRVAIGGTVTFLSATIDGGPYDGNDLPGVPDTRLTFQAQAPLASRFTLGFEGQYVGARPFEGDFANTFDDQDDYFTVNTKLTYRQGPARIFLDVKNLFDAEYSEYGVLGGFPRQRAYYPSPGIHAIAGVELKF